MSARYAAHCTSVLLHCVACCAAAYCVCSLAMLLLALLASAAMNSLLLEADTCNTEDELDEVNDHSMATSRTDWPNH